jgi:hypothetical protein
MNIEDAVEIAYEAMDNIQDYDTTLHMYARAAVDALGWQDIATTLPELNQTVVCTDGKARWLDMRFAERPDMQWQGHTPTHWHPILELPASISVKPTEPRSLMADFDNAIDAIRKA